MKANKLILLAILAFLVAIQVQADTTATNFERKVTLKVLSPQNLQTVFTKYNNQIPNFLSPYGIIPWGKSFKGQLEIADPPNACQRLQYDPNQNTSQRPFLLVEVDSANGCSIETKIYNAQNHGASLVILILKDKNSQQTWEKDQQKLQLISIPVIQVSSEIGQSLTLATKDSQPQERPTLIANYPTKDETSNYLRIYADISSFETYQLLQALHLYNNIHENKYHITINYSIPETILNTIEDDDTSEQANIERKEIQESQQKYCYGNGKFCDSDNPTTILEIIRQTCVFTNSQAEFFKYIQSQKQSFTYHMAQQIQNLLENGLETYFDFDFFSKKAITDSQIDPAVIEKCISSSFIEQYDSQNQLVPRYKQDNYILNHQHQSFEELKGHSQLPFVYLNNKEIRPSSSQYTSDVLRVLCEIDNDIDSTVCIGLFKLKKNTNRGLNTGQIVLIVMGSLAGSVILCYIFARLYSRYQKRRYSTELERVDSLVQAYIELNSDREKQQTNT